MDQAEQVQGAEALETREIRIAGMGCDNCVRKLEKALRAKDGVKEVRVDGIAGRAKVTFDLAKTGFTGGKIKVTASFLKTTSPFPKIQSPWTFKARGTVFLSWKPDKRSVKG